jgi:hypothetical protein
VPSQGEDFHAGHRVPELDRPVVTGRRQPAAIRAERHAIDVGRVADQRRDHPAALRIAQIDRISLVDPTATVQVVDPSTDDLGDELAIGTGDAPTPAGNRQELPRRLDGEFGQ